MLIVKRTLLTGAWLYGGHRTCAKTVAVPCGTSQLNSTVTTLVDIQNVLCKATVTRSELHTTRALTEHSVSLEVENRAIVAIVKRLGLRDEALSKCSYICLSTEGWHWGRKFSCWDWNQDWNQDLLITSLVLYHGPRHTNNLHCVLCIETGHDEFDQLPRSLESLAEIEFFIFFISFWMQAECLFFFLSSLFFL